MDAAAAKAMIDERAPAVTCSVCGGSDWLLAKDGKPITFLSFEAKDDPRIRVLAIVCGTCGYVRFHSLELLELLEPPA